MMPRSEGTSQIWKKCTASLGGRVGFAVQHAGAGAHPLHVAGPDDRSGPHLNLRG